MTGKSLLLTIAKLQRHFPSLLRFDVPSHNGSGAKHQG
jgi:hypothetical protein